MAETDTEPTSTIAEDAAEAAKNITTLSDYDKVREALITDSSEAMFDFDARPVEAEPMPEEEPATPEAETETAEAAPVEAKAPKKQGRPTSKQKSAKSRIDKVVWEREEARKEAASLRDQLVALRSSAETRPATNETPASPAAAAASASVPETSPTDDEPRENQFTEYGDFIAAKARWAARSEVNAALQAAHQQQQQSQQQGYAQQRASQFADRVEALSSDDPEFLARIQPEILNLRPAMSLQKGETPTGATAIADLLVDSESPHQMMEYLSSHEDDFRRISALHPMLAMRELGRIEVGLGAAPHGSAPTPVSSQAAPPIQPVRSSATTSATTRSPSDIQTVSEWEVARKQLLHQR